MVFIYVFLKFPGIRYNKQKISDPGKYIYVYDGYVTEYDTKVKYFFAKYLYSFRYSNKIVSEY